MRVEPDNSSFQTLPANFIFGSSLKANLQASSWSGSFTLKTFTFTSGKENVRVKFSKKIDALADKTCLRALSGDTERNTSRSLA